MSKHSPGPWRIVRVSDFTGDQDDTCILDIRDAEGWTVYYTDSGYFEPRESDVSLIVKAPEMYELLRCVQVNLRAGMPRSIQKMQARIIEELMKEIHQ